MHSIRSCQDTDRRLLMGELVEVKSSMKEQQGTSRRGFVQYSVTVILDDLCTMCTKVVENSQKGWGLQ